MAYQTISTEKKRTSISFLSPSHLSFLPFPAFPSSCCTLSPSPLPLFLSNSPISPHTPSHLLQFVISPQEPGAAPLKTVTLGWILSISKGICMVPTAGEGGDSAADHVTSAGMEHLSGGGLVEGSWLFGSVFLKGNWDPWGLSVSCCEQGSTT